MHWAKIKTIATKIKSPLSSKISKGNKRKPQMHGNRKNVTKERMANWGAKETTGKPVWEGA